MMVVSLLFLFVSLVVGTIGVDLLRRYTGLSNNDVLSWFLTVSVSLVGVFVFLASAYVVLTNTDLDWRQVLPGAAVAAVLLEATFQFLPAFVRISKHNPVLQTLSGPAVLLVWLYVMANVIVLGAEVNYWWKTHPEALRRARGPHGHDASGGASRRLLSRRPFAFRRPG
jgi:uncharacterized BrkB/YihY/UPF0761 family membrane protein